LWNADNSVANNTIRKTLTDATYTKMSNKDGDALYEVSNEISYCGKNSSGVYVWLKEATDTASNSASGWNDDYQFYGFGPRTWIARGGYFTSGSFAGIYATVAGDGSMSNFNSFRPTLVTGLSL
jgi:hypothetical protein